VTEIAPKDVSRRVRRQQVLKVVPAWRHHRVSLLGSRCELVWLNLMLRVQVCEKTLVPITVREITADLGLKPEEWSHTAEALRRLIEAKFVVMKGRATQRGEYSYVKVMLPTEWRKFFDGDRKLPPQRHEMAASSPDQIPGYVFDRKLPIAHYRKVLDAGSAAAAVYRASRLMKYTANRAPWLNSGRYARDGLAQLEAAGIHCDFSPRCVPARPKAASVVRMPKDYLVISALKAAVAEATPPAAPALDA